MRIAVLEAPVESRSRGTLEASELGQSGQTVPKSPPVTTPDEIIVHELACWCGASLSHRCCACGTAISAQTPRSGRRHGRVDDHPRSRAPEQIQEVLRTNLAAAPVVNVDEIDL